MSAFMQANGHSSWNERQSVEENFFMPTKTNRFKREKSEIANWIDAGLKRPGKSQQGLAAALGVTTTIVARLRKGSRKLPAEEVQAVAEYLGTMPPMIPLELKKDLVQKSVPILGRIGDNLSYAEDHSFDEIEVLPVLAPEYQGLHQKALFVNDDAFDLGKIPCGSLIFYVPYWPARNVLRDGDIVLYRYYKVARAGRREKAKRSAVYCIRRVHKTATGFELRPETSKGRSAFRSFYLSGQQARYSEKHRNCIIGWVIHSEIDFMAGINELETKPADKPRSLRSQLMSKLLGMR